MRLMRTACCITKATKHTLSICDNYCLFTATIVAGTRLAVTVYVNFLLFTVKDGMEHINTPLIAKDRSL